MLKASSNCKKHWMQLLWVLLVECVITKVFISCIQGQCSVCGRWRSCVLSWFLSLVEISMSVHSCLVRQTRSEIFNVRSYNTDILNKSSLSLLLFELKPSFSPWNIATRFLLVCHLLYRLLCLLFQPYVSSYVSSFNPFVSYVSFFNDISPPMWCFLFQPYVSSFNSLSPMSPLSTPMSPPMSPLSTIYLLLCDVSFFNPMSPLFRPYVSSYELINTTFTYNSTKYAVYVGTATNYRCSARMH